MKNIEVEVRSFISKEKYEQLLVWMKENAEFLSDDEQITYYFDCEEDLRIQQNRYLSKVILKKGKMYDEHREEHELEFERERFADLEKFFLALGYGVEIKWFRVRNNFKWKGIDVAVDYTKGYGHVLEMEKMSTEEEKSQVLEELKQKTKELGVELTPKEKLLESYEFYRKNWKDLV
ncbi:CYTH domain-containing protein [Thermoproteota archaeon]